MSVSKVKNLVIAVLVLINVFFLILLVTDKAADIISVRQAVENACYVLTQSGISISPNDVHKAGTLRQLRTTRNPVEEERIATVILGPVERDDRGVNYRYENKQRGVAVFYSSGDFLIEVKDGLVVSSGGVENTVKKLLREMGIETSELFHTGANGNETVTAVCAYKRASVFNCTIKFSFDGGSLLSVSGRYVLGAEDTEDAAEISSPGTALLGFLAWARRSGIECTRIDMAQAGYRLRDTSAFGDGILAPVWLISADTGQYTIDALTGEVQSLPGVLSDRN